MGWTTRADAKLFASKQDPDDPRLAEWCTRSEIINLDDVNGQTVAPPGTPWWSLLGYPDDEGIAMNGGRVGAKEAPDTIRALLYKMTPSLLRPRRVNLVDIGNLSTEVPLAERHQRGRALIRESLSRGARTLSLGGGHDYGYADGAGFLDFALAQHQRPVIVNFDAHLDVRPCDKGFHSGTAFHRLLTDYAGKFDFIEVGLQNQCNSMAHLQWAQQQGAKTVLLQDIRTVGLVTVLEPMLTPLAGRPCFVSIDIDGFSSSEAPGCSQSWTSGLHFAEFSPALQWIQQNLNMQSLGIYEVAPCLDLDRVTSKLAALILHQTLFE